MNLDFEKALTYIAKDPGWSNKILAGGGLLLATFAIFIIPVFLLILTTSGVIGLTSFILCFVFSIILSLVLAGYMAQTSNKRLNYQNSLLPDWSEFGRFIITGLKYFVGYFLYTIPLILLTSVFAGLVITAVHGCPDCGLLNTMFFILITLIGALTLFVYILYIVFCPLMMACFFSDLKILSFVDFKKAFDMLKNNVGNYCILILLFIAISMLGQLLCSILMITIVGIIFIPIVYFYIYLVIAELCAQFVLSARDKE